MNAEQLKEKLETELGGEWTIKAWPPSASDIDPTKWFGFYVFSPFRGRCIHITLPDEACIHKGVDLKIDDKTARIRTLEDAIEILKPFTWPVAPQSHTLPTQANRDVVALLIQSKLKHALGGEWTVVCEPAQASDITLGKWFGFTAWPLPHGKPTVSIPDKACTYPGVRVSWMGPDRRFDGWRTDTLEQAIERLVIEQAIERQMRRTRTPDTTITIHGQRYDVFWPKSGTKETPPKD